MDIIQTVIEINRKKAIFRQYQISAIVVYVKSYGSNEILFLSLYSTAFIFYNGILKGLTL